MTTIAAAARIAPTSAPIANVEKPAFEAIAGSGEGEIATAAVVCVVCICSASGEGVGAGVGSIVAVGVAVLSSLDAGVGVENGIGLMLCVSAMVEFHFTPKRIHPRKAV